MIETIVGLFNQIVGFVVKLFSICLLIALFGLGFLNMLHQEVEKQRKLRERR